MASNPVGWFEIYVEDMDRARKFYESVLNIRLEPLAAPANSNHPDMEMWAFPMHANEGGAPGALVKMKGVRPGAGGTLAYFSCVDCAMEAGRVAAAGGRLFREKTSIGQYGFIALVLDSEGNLIGLHSRA